MKIGVKVGDIMTRNFIHASPDITVIQAAQEMIKKHVGSLVIKRNGELLGILTEKDIIAAMLRKKDLEKTKVSDIMSRKVRTISPEEDIYDALVQMKKSKYRWLPVSVKKKVIGMLTIKDILRIEPSLFDIARETMSIREETEKIKRKEAVLRGEVSWTKEGECGECGAYGLLYNIDGRLLCESCKDIAE